MSEDKVEYVRTPGDEDVAEVQAAILAPGVGGEVHYNESDLVRGALDAQAAAERALYAERRKVKYLRETLQFAALEYPHVGVFQTVLEETK